MKKAQRVKRDKKEELAIILKECRAVRRWALRQNGGDPTGMCSDSSLELRDRLEKHGIKIKVKDGTFKIDFEGKLECDKCTRSAAQASHAEAHTWCEWQGMPIDVTADQFNKNLRVENKAPKILIGTHFDRYLTWSFKSIYSHPQSVKWILETMS